MINDAKIADTHPPDRRITYLLIPLLITVTVVLAYSNSLSGAFILDDFQNIVRNPSIGNFREYVSNSTRPITNATFFLNHWVGEMNVSGYHTVNLIIHTLSALFIYAILRRSLLSPRLHRKYCSNATYLAATIACIWAIHPLQTAAVTYIVQRAESLMSLFYLSTLYCAIRSTNSGQRRYWYVAAVTSCAVGMATKPVMVTAPIIVLLYDIAFLGNKGFKQLIKERLSLYISLMATWSVLLFLLVNPNESTTSTGLNANLISPLHYLATQAEVITHYLYLVVNPSEMCLDYAWTASNMNPATLLLVTAFGVLVVLGVVSLTKRHAVGFLALWFFVVLAPTSSIIPIADYAFDHRVYLASLAPICAIVLVSYRLLADRTKPIVLCTVAAATICALGSLTYARNMDYLSEEIMWRDVVAKRPMNLRAENNLAVALSERAAFDEAISSYSSVLQKIPLVERKRLDQGEITTQAVIPANSFRANYFRAHANLGLLQYRIKANLPKALEHYDLALGVYPDDAGVKAKRDKALQELSESKQKR